jgi:hypothetical protein
VGNGLNASPDVLTERSDASRSGAVSRPGFNASIFNPSHQWGLLNMIPVDGPVNAQPLYATRVTASFDNRVHDVLFVVSGRNTAYAFDANDYQPLWKTVLGPVPAFGDPNRGILSTPVLDPAKATLFTTYRTPNAASQRDEWHVAAVRARDGHVMADHRVTSSPWSSATRRGGIDDTGACDATVELCGDSAAYYQRPGLLLENDVLYVAFGGDGEGAFDWTGLGNADHTLTVGFLHNEQVRYRGQLLAFDVRHGLAFAGRWTSVTGRSRLGGGIWQGAVGPAADANGDIYLATGNAFSDPSIDPTHNSRARQDADFSPATDSFGNSVVRLHPTVSTAGATTSVAFQVAQSFSPYRSYWMNVTDADLGASGPLLVPGTNQLVEGGKEGLLYILDRDKMGGASQPLTPAEYWSYPTQAALPCPGAGAWPAAVVGSGRQIAYQPNAPSRDGLGPSNELDSTNFDIPSPAMSCWPAWPHVHGTPVFGSVPGAGSYMYVWPEKDYLKAYTATSLTPLRFASSPAINDSVAPSPAGMPGGMLTLVTDPAGGGVLLAQVPVESIPFDVNFNNVVYTAYGSLHAYDPVPDASGRLRELWNDSGTAWYRSSGFVPPTVGANNRVYVATGLEPGATNGYVVVYGAGSGDSRPRYSAPSGGVTAFHQNVASRMITAAIVGTDGAVHIFWELNNDSWQTPGQQAVVTPPGVAPAGAPIASVALQDGVTFDTFFVDNQGALNWLSVRDGQDWVTHPRITDTGFAPVGAKVSAYAQGSSLVDVFVVGNDGAAYVFSRAPWDFSFPDGLRISPTGTYGSGARFAAGSHTAGLVSLLSVDRTGTLYESTTLANVRGGWGAPAPVPSAQGFDGWGDLASTGDFYWAAVDARGALRVMANTGGGWQQYVLTGPNAAPNGGGVAMGYFAGVPMVFTVGNEGAIDVYQRDNGGSWTPAHDAHTQSFGTATAGAPLAVALQASDQGAEVLDVLVQGKTDVFVSWIAQLYFPGASQPYWARPGWIFH